MTTRQEVEDLGLTRDQLLELSRIARVDGIREASTANSLSTPAADAIGARFWLERVAERMEAMEHLRLNAGLWAQDPHAWDRAVGQVETAQRPVERAQALVTQQRHNTFDPNVLA
jgi:hypothetical protein